MAGTRISRRSMLGTVGAASLAPVVNAGARAEVATAGSPEVQPAFAGNLTVGAIERDGTVLRAASITGGTLHGSCLAGAVHGGRIEWLPRTDGSHEVQLRFHVQGADGHQTEVVQRTVLAPDADLQGCWPVNAVTEPLGDDGVPAGAALLVGRLDATRLQQGLLTLLTFEVA